LSGPNLHDAAQFFCSGHRSVRRSRRGRRNLRGGNCTRLAALRGLRVALIDKADFASGTSRPIPKLIHGGFRYLEQAACRLVIESCRERQVLQKMASAAPGEAIALLLPVYQGDQRSLGTMRIGMTLYDALALYRNTARPSGVVGECDG